MSAKLTGGSRWPMLMGALALLWMGCTGDPPVDEDPTTPPGGDTPTPLTPTSSPTPTLTPVPEVAQLVLSATAVDFGEVRVAEEGQAELTLENQGNAILSVDLTILDLKGGSFSIVDTPLKSLQLDPGDDQTLILAFAPEAEGVSQGRLTLTSNDPQALEVDVPLEGEGLPPASTDGDLDGVTQGEGDCDDADPFVYPQAAEACDGIDNDCDEDVDEDGSSLWYLDEDQDGWGDPSSGTSACSPTDGRVRRGEDCDDASSQVYPDAAELCDELDNDCDGETDEGVTQTFYLDGDGDGYGSSQSSLQACSMPEGYASADGDCDDEDATRHPGQAELCDGEDQDCDGVDDDGLPTTLWYQDGDGDGHGDPATGVASCGSVEGAVALGEDCQDDKATVYPGATEACNGVDDDCDSQTDEEGPTTFYKDVDGDGYGASSTAVTTCKPGAGWVSQGGDCADGDAAMSPAGVETCDTKDNDCDGQTDEGVLKTFYQDLDKDGYGTPAATQTGCAPSAGYAPTSDDCKDNDASIHPGVTETCDGVDNNCDGAIDEGLVQSFYLDTDGDGYGSGTPKVGCTAPVGYVAKGGDCNEANVNLNPGIAETCDKVDNDCDGVVDDGVQTTYYQDLDKDGYGLLSVTMQACSGSEGWSAVSGDCNDTRADIYPGGAEKCDKADNDCDGQVDEDNQTLFYQDQDKDGYGSSQVTVMSCASPAGFVANSSDCDDTDPELNPSATEVCDELDNNCNGQVDEGAAAPPTWYPDVDRDGYGNETGGITTCDRPTGYKADNQDCNDLDPDIYPGAEDIPGNGIDEDCSGQDKPANDLDGDGYPDIVMSNFQNGTSYKVDSYIYWGSASGYSTASRSSLPTLGARKACVADFDQDGWLDIFFLNHQSAAATYAVNSYLYWGSPDGYISSDRLDIPTVGAYDCDVADYNKDGWLDLAIANLYDGSSYTISSYVYLNQSGLFDTAHRTSLDTKGAAGVVSADLNDDTYLDLVFASSRDNSVYSVDSYIYWGSSTGFSNSQRLGLPSIGPVTKPTVGDLNDDGRLDVVFNNYYNGTTNTVNTFIYWGSDFGTTSRGDIPGSGNVGTIVKDVDGDSFEDLVVANHYDGDDTVNSYVFFGSTKGFDTGNRQALIGNRTRGLAVADVNEDGYEDILLGTFYDGDYQTKSYLYYGSSKGYDTSRRFSMDSNGVYSAAIRDVDLDGWLDVLLGSYSDGDFATTAYVYWNSPRGFAQTSRTDIPTEGATQVTMAELNHDEYPELIYANFQSTGSSYQGSSYIYWGSPSGPSSDRRTSLPTLGAKRSCVGDLNGDTWPEVVFANHRNDSSRKVNSSIYWGSATGYTSTNVTQLPTIGAWSCLLADVDADLDLDVVFSNHYDGTSYSQDSYIYLNDGGTFSSSRRWTAPTVGAVGAAAADLDGDGYPELVFSNRFDGTNYNMGSYLYWGSATGYSSGDRQVLTSYGPEVAPLIDDVDEDGFLDIMVVNGWDGDNAVNSYLYWGSETGYADSNRYIFTANRTVDALIKDLNGDGYKDVVLATYYDGDENVNNQVWWGSVNGFTTGNRVLLPSNRAWSVAAPDINQDGLLDLVFAVYQDGDYATSSMVYFGTSAGYGASASLQLPTSGALGVVAGDLDADGLADLAFANNWNGTSYAVSSSVFWNSRRGLANNARTEMPVVGSYGMDVIGDN